MEPVLFESFDKIPRLSRDIVITEKIDGTNAQIYFDIDDPSTMYVGSRKRWITPEEDNFGFARWCTERRDELLATLGYGRHFGEWWGSGIQRGYGLEKGEKRFSLFNAKRWAELNSGLVSTVPLLYEGPFTTDVVESTVLKLQIGGSKAAPGFMNPEGVIIFHTAGSLLFKKTIYDDEKPKGLVKK